MFAEESADPAARRLASVPWLSIFAVNGVLGLMLLFFQLPPGLQRHPRAVLGVVLYALALQGVFHLFFLGLAWLPARPARALVQSIETARLSFLAADLASIAVVGTHLYD